MRIRTGREIHRQALQKEAKRNTKSSFANASIAFKIYSKIFFFLLKSLSRLKTRTNRRFRISLARLNRKEISFKSIYKVINHKNNANLITLKDLFQRETFFLFFFSKNTKFFFFLLVRCFSTLIMKIYVRKCNFTWNWFNLSTWYLSFYHFGLEWFISYSRYLCLDLSFL